MNRAQRREAKTHPTTATPAPAPFHVHATGMGQQVVSIPADAAQVLLNVCNLPGVGEHLQTSQAKLQVGYAQQALEVALASIKAVEPTAEAPTDDNPRDDEPER